MQHTTTLDALPRGGFLPWWLFHPWVRGFLAAAFTYSATVAAVAWNGPPQGMNMQINGRAAGPGDWGLVLLFTISHAVIPVFFYRLFLVPSPGRGANSPPTTFEKSRDGCARAFVYMHLGCWYGLPIVFLGSVTSWLSLLGIPLIGLTARRGERVWAFLEYGSSSMAMLLVVGTIGVQHVWGVLVVLIQAVLLGLTHVTGKQLWTAAPSAASRVVAANVVHD